MDTAVDPGLARAMQGQSGTYPKQAGAAFVGAVVVLAVARPPFVVDEGGSLSLAHVAGWSAVTAAFSFASPCWV